MKSVNSCGGTNAEGVNQACIAMGDLLDAVACSLQSFDETRVTRQCRHCTSADSSIHRHLHFPWTDTVTAYNWIQQYIGSTSLLTDGCVTPTSTPDQWL
jgi:hypothetical protein